ncbi:uncharacterized protein [Amphiura filiformis]|uniref:uncharacterized protein n=1 Tax=Amphiura filiformis TaxID=82378 RepID=UPI003B20E081
MPGCKVVKCKSHTGRSSQESVRLFCFPKDPETARKWLALCGVETDINTYKFSDSDRVCSLHFEKDQIGYDMLTRVLLEAGKLKRPPVVKLKEGAIPTLNLPSRSDVAKPISNTVTRIAVIEKKKQRSKVSQFQYLCLLMEGDQPYTPGNEVHMHPESCPNRPSWRYCMICSCGLGSTSHWQSFRGGLRNSEEIVKKLQNVLDINISEVMPNSYCVCAICMRKVKKYEDGLAAQRTLLSNFKQTVMRKCLTLPTTTPISTPPLPKIKRIVRDQGTPPAGENGGTQSHARKRKNILVCTEHSPEKSVGELRHNLRQDQDEDASVVKSSQDDSFGSIDSLQGQNCCKPADHPPSGSQNCCIPADNPPSRLKPVAIASAVAAAHSTVPVVLRTDGGGETPVTQVQDGDGSKKTCLVCGTEIHTCDSYCLITTNNIKKRLSKFVQSDTHPHSLRMCKKCFRRLVRIENGEKLKQDFVDDYWRTRRHSSTVIDTVPSEQKSSLPCKDGSSSKIILPESSSSSNHQGPTKPTSASAPPHSGPVQKTYNLDTAKTISSPATDSDPVNQTSHQKLMATRSGKRRIAPEPSSDMHDPIFAAEVERISGWSAAEFDLLLAENSVPDHWNGKPCAALLESIRNRVAASAKSYRKAFPDIFEALNLRPMHLAGLLAKLRRLINKAKSSKNMLLLMEEMPGLSLNSDPQIGPLCQSSGITPQSLISSSTKSEITNGMIIELNKYRKKTNTTWKVVGDVWWPNLFKTDETVPLAHGTILSSWRSLAKKRGQVSRRRLNIQNFLESIYILPEPKSVAAEDTGSSEETEDEYDDYFKFYPDMTSDHTVNSIDYMEPFTNLLEEEDITPVYRRRRPFTCLYCSTCFCDFDQFQWHKKRHIRARWRPKQQLPNQNLEVETSRCETDEYSFLGTPGDMNNSLIATPDDMNNSLIAIPDMNNSLITIPDDMNNSLIATCDGVDLDEEVNNVFVGGSADAHMDTDLTKYVCPTCNTCFETSTDLIGHVRIHFNTDIKPYRCDHCGKEFGQKGHLVQHIKTHAKTRPFECVQCNKQFTRRGDLKRHLKIHIGIKPFQCFSCSMSFHEKDSLNKHIDRMHSMIKPYQCTYCHKTFSRTDDFGRHIRTVHEARPSRQFACGFCGKAFQTKDHLAKHERIHTGDKPFGCEVCGKAFSRKHDMKRHSAKHLHVFFPPQTPAFIPSDQNQSGGGVSLI